MTEPDSPRLEWRPYRLANLWEIMQQFDSGRLTGALAALAGWRQSLANYKPADPHLPPAPYFMDESDYKRMTESVQFIYESCERLELPVGLSKVSILLRLLNEPPDQEPPTGLNLRGMIGISQARLLQMQGLAEQICYILPAELSGKLAFVIPSVNYRLITSKDLFGSDVAQKFASLSYEIEEAGKCRALARSTACAFHSIRCLEGGIRAISRCLSIPDPTKGSDRSWHNMLRAIKGQLDKRWPSFADKSTGDGRFFEDVYASLSGMQNPWRNATMHLDQKYTEEEAKHIMEVVDGFMRKVAARCDEDGNPLA